MHEQAAEALGCALLLSADRWSPAAGRERTEGSAGYGRPAFWFRGIINVTFFPYKETVVDLLDGLFLPMRQAMEAVNTVVIRGRQTD